MVKVEDKYGITCPNEGLFYTCSDAPTQFIGCCTSNPCSNGGVCPDDDVRATSFDEDKFEDILEQGCASNATDVLWYTCGATSPPFMGCCSENPCSEGCPQKSLHAAVLSEKSANAKNFLDTSDVTTTASSTSATATATSTDSADEGSGGGLSKGAVGGIAAGAAVGGLLLIGLIAFLIFRKKRRARSSSTQAYEPYAGQQAPAPQAQDTKFPSPQYTPNSPNFPSPDPQMQQQQGYYNPQGFQQFHQPPQSPGSPPYYATQYAQSPPVGGLSPYNQQGVTPTHQHFRESMTPSELPSEPSRSSMVPGGMAAPAELEENTRQMLKNDRAVEAP